MKCDLLAEFRSISIVGFAGCLFAALTTLSHVAAAPPLKSPLSPQQSLAELVAAPGCVIELAAAEPEVVDCVACRFDEHGRMWVVEMRDYPHGPQSGDPPKSRIRILQDKDGDGRFESATTFADELLFVTGLQLWRDGAFVTHAGKISLLRDTDGDLRVDDAEVWFTGFAEENTQLRANHPTLAPDGWIYVANGLRGGVVQGTRENDKPLEIRGKDFRFHPVTRNYEAVSGNGQFGLTIDTFGNRFLCTNRNPLKHVVFEDRYLTGPAAGLIGAAVTDVAAAGAESRVYSITNAWTTSNLHAGQFTAACGVHHFGGDGLPAEFVGNAFTCDPTGSLVHREVLTSAGATFVSKPGREGVEFLASRDSWFRPVNISTGPDGALYVVDMYRAVIEHPQWMPEELRIRPDLMLGNDRGRIYRIKTKASAETPSGKPLGLLALNDLPAELESENSWRQSEAFRLLIQAEPKEAAAALRSWVKSKGGLAGVTNGLIAPLLSQAGGLSNDELLALAKESKRPEMRRQAIQLLEPRLAKDDHLRESVANLLAAETNAGVKHQLLLSIAPLKKEEAELLRQAMQFPATSKTTDAAANDLAMKWLSEAVLLAGQELPRVGLEIGLAKPTAESSPHLLTLTERFAVLAAGKAKQTADRQQIVKTILNGENETTLSAALVAVGKAWGGRLPELADQENQLFQQRTQMAATEAKDATLPRPARIRSVKLLALSKANVPLLLTLAMESDSQAVRIEAIGALARLGDEPDWRNLESTFGGATPSIRAEMVRGLASRESLTPVLLDWIETKAVRPAELDRATQARLQRLKNPELKKRAAGLLASANPADRVKALAEFQASLKLKGDPAAGAKWFGKTCSSCHRVGKIGVNVAPDISDSRTKTTAQLLGDIVQPNRAIDANYVGYLVETDDGKTLAGIIAEETAAAVVLKMPGDKTVTIDRTKIVNLTSTGVSLMPVGLEREFTKQQMADLLAYIKNWRYLDEAGPPILSN